MRTNIKNKRGISLIVLVLTIIVMIILAIAIILSISNSGIIGRSNEAKIKSDIKTMQEELQVLKANETLGEDDEITITDLSSAKGYDGKFDIQDGELKFVRSGLSEDEIAIAEDMDIKPYATVLKGGYNGITISNPGVLTVDATAFNLAGITDIKIPNNVTKIEMDAFSNCNTLLSVVIPSSVTDFFAAFETNESLIEVTLMDGLKIVSTGAFYGCSSLVSVHMPNSIEAIEQDAFSGCSSLTDINIPYSVRSMGTDCFSGCSSLRSAVIPCDTFYTAFYGCSSLTKVVFLDGVENIGESAFMETNLSEISLPDTLRSIKSFAFALAPLTSITIPANVTTIGTCAFGSSSLKNITIEGTARFTADEVKSWLDVSDLSGITITGSGYIAE